MNETRVHEERKDVAPDMEKLKLILDIPLQLTVELGRILFLPGVPILHWKLVGRILEG